MDTEKKWKRKLSLISSIHYYKLLYRGLLFLWAAMTYLLRPKFHVMTFAQAKDEFKVLFGVIWILLAIEMVARFFPSPTESMGSQKQFAKNYLPTGKERPDLKKINHGLPMVILSWVLLNGAIYALHALEIITDGILILIALFYSVSDMICILFFCPFQTWMMKNRCCGMCRIYNWDYLMMVTPLIVIPSVYTYSLVILALILFIRWEITAWKHPERFSDETNTSLRCVNCQEKLCAHKKQLHTFWKSERERLQKLQQETTRTIHKH